MKGYAKIGLLLLSNVFMTLAWYGHLKFKELKWFENAFQVPANRIGYEGNRGPFSLLQLKAIQEVTTLVIFLGLSMLFFKSETFKWNHALGLLFMVFAVYFIFKK